MEGNCYPNVMYIYTLILRLIYIWPLNYGKFFNERKADLYIVPKSVQIMLYPAACVKYL